MQFMNASCSRLVSEDSFRSWQRGWIMLPFSCPPSISCRAKPSINHPWASPSRQSRTRLINSPPVSFIWMRILVPAPSNSITLSVPIDPPSNSTNSGPLLLLLSRLCMFAVVAVFAGLGVNEVSIPGLSELAIRELTAIALLTLPVLALCRRREHLSGLLGAPSTLLFRFQ